MASTLHTLFGLEVMRLVKAALEEPFRRALSQHESRVRSSLVKKPAELSTQGEVTFVKDSDGVCRVDASVSSRADLCIVCRECRYDVGGLLEYQHGLGQWLHGAGTGACTRSSSYCML